MVQPFDNEGGQGMVEYLLIVSLVVLTILGMFAGLMHLWS
jgi:Flp pilus assembly pilin Flp